MNRLIAYPYNSENCCLATYSGLLEDYILTGFICTKESPYAGKDAGWLEETETDIMVSNDFDKELEHCDTVFIGNGLNDHLFSVYLEKIKTAAAKGKEIILTKHVYQLVSEKLDPHIPITVLDNEGECNNSYNENQIYDIDIPVVSITSLGESSNKFDVQLKLREAFQSLGYQVLQFGSRNMCSMFGMVELPQFLFERNLSISDKILRFNHFIHEKLQEQEADIILIGAAGGIMPINKYIHNHFGEIPYIISQALKIDLNIVCLYMYQDLNEEFLENIRNFSRGHLGCDTEYINIGRTSYSYNPENDENPFDVYNHSKEYCLGKQPELAADEYTISYLFSTDYTELASNMVEQLSSNIEVI